MITCKENIFRLDTAHTTYIFRRTEFGHLEHIYYGKLLDEDEKVEKLAQKRTTPIGSSVVYDEADELYSLDVIPLEWSDNGRGDYRQSPTEIKMPDGSFVSDFVFVSYSIKDGCIPMKTLPSAYGGDQTLIVTLKDTTSKVELMLYYTIFEKTDVITRRAVLSNNDEDPLIIRRMMSMMIDISDEDFCICTLDGGWIKETHLHRRSVEYGTFINSSTTGSSSNRHNPGFMLAQKDATEDVGIVYGFNLVYSGNHFSGVQKSQRDLVRISAGINPHCFEWNLASGECFETPEAVMAFSHQGYNGMSHNMHNFVNEHIVRGVWKNRERPVLVNSWEAHFFNYNEKKLMDLAKEAKRLGAELFVLDDGWFGERNDDKAGLGDYSINNKKFPNGVKAFSDRIHSLGLEFGLWFEPEMVNPNSDLYRTHPEYAVKHPKKKPVTGRYQLLLDLCKKEVREYITENVGAVVDDANVNYVKWDMNRHIAEAYSSSLVNQGEFYHRYILGLYEILERIFGPRQHILLESCSSGGNRFDLGMLCYSPQIWCSDNTDPIERLKIQTGLSYFYPPSVMGAHVSDSPHQQTLRSTPLATRFNVSCFACLGYEMDLKHLSPEEKKDVTEQIAFYKKYRRIFQYGTFSRMKAVKSNKVIWQSVSDDKNTALTGFFQVLSAAAESDDKLIVTGLNSGRYSVRSRPQRLFIERFGGLVKHIMPVDLHLGSFVLNTVNRHYSLSECTEEYECSSGALCAGIPLKSQYMGTGYNKNVRMLGDFGSKIYITEKANREETQDD